MDPSCYDHCPVCRRETHQWAGTSAGGPGGEKTVWFVCEECETLLLVDDSGVVGQRAASERELAVLPRRARRRT